MASYLFLLYGGPGSDEGLSPQEMQGIIEKYSAWANKIRESGHWVGGNKLKDGEGRVLRAGNGKPRVLDGPFSETKEVIGGYLAVTADNYEDAMTLVEDCPHLAYGGTVEIREIEEHE